MPSRGSSALKSQPIEETIKKRQNITKSGINPDDPTSWPDLSRPNSRMKMLGTGSTITNSKTVTFNEGVKQDESKETVRVKNNPQLVEQLVEYARLMQEKVVELETKLKDTKEIYTKKERELRGALRNELMKFQDNQSIGSSIGSIGSPYKKHNRNDHKQSSASVTSVESSIVDEGIKETMGDIDLKVLHLKELFRKDDPMSERHSASTLITSRIRGFLQRSRYKRYQKGITEWKWSRCRNIVYVLDIMMNSKVKSDAAFNRHKLSREIKTLLLVFSKWNFVVKQTAPLRRAVRKAAEDKFVTKQKELLKSVFGVLKDVCVGYLSVKNANKERFDLIEQIRRELSEQYKANGLIGVVLHDEVMRVYYRKVLLKFLAQKEKLQLRGIYNGFVKAVNMARRNLRDANKHWFNNIAGKCFYAWSDHIYMVSQGLDRRRWKGPRKYEIRYNQKRIDTFAKHRLLRYVYKPWSEYFKLQSNVRKCYQRQVALFVRNNFHALRARCQVQRRLREETVSTWRSYSRVMTQKPFQAWASWYRNVKNNNNEQERIVSKYCKWKWKQRMLLIIRTWRHQALYGRIDGMYTRQMLVQSLTEQKQLATSLERMMAAQTVQLEECMDIVEKEISKRKDLERKIGSLNTEINKYKMVQHHLEEETKRVEAIVDAMAIINPRQVEHLKALQLAFNFKERKIEVQKDDALLGKKKKKDKNKRRPSSAKSGETTARTEDDEGLELSDDEVEEKEFNIMDVQEVVDENPQNVENAAVAPAVNADNSATNEVAKDSSASPNPTPNKAESKSGATAEVTKASPAPIESAVIRTDTTSTEATVPETVVNNARLSPADQIFLDRVKWIVSRFGPQSQVDESINGVTADNNANPVEEGNVSSSASPVKQSKNTTTETSTLETNELLPTTKFVVSKSKLGGTWNNHAVTPEDTAVMLFSVIDFLTTGDVTAFSPEDRRDWTSHIFHSIYEERIDAAMSEKQKDVNRELVAEATEIVSTKTWRNTLLSLRAMFPGAGNYSGVGVPLDKEYSGMPLRLMDMRSTMMRVMKNSERKFGSSTMNSDEMEPLNVYASNIEIVVSNEGERGELKLDAAVLHDDSFDDEVEMSP
jgi:hypothetical protein